VPDFEEQPDGPAMPTLTPVDYDPFADTAAAAPKPPSAGYNPFSDPAAAPKLISVDHDPVADGAGVPARLVPVDYDPFADGKAVAPRLIPANAELWVFPPENAVAKDAYWIDQPKRYVGDSETPKPPSTEGVKFPGADDEN
jgi:hypothetical protein